MIKWLKRNFSFLFMTPEEYLKQEHPDLWGDMGDLFDINDLQLCSLIIASANIADAWNLSNDSMGVIFNVLVKVTKELENVETD